MDDLGHPSLYWLFDTKHWLLDDICELERNAPIRNNGHSVDASLASRL